MAYQNRWNSNDRIPNRAVDDGFISRFGQIDMTDGGSSERYSLSGAWRHAAGNSVQDVQLFAISSGLSLYSDFTYFLDNPTRGDQFNQTEFRTIVGGAATHSQQVELFGTSHLIRIGVQSRSDIVNGLALYRTHARIRDETVRDDRVGEVGSGVYVETASRWTPWFRTELGVRGDLYLFNVMSDRTVVKSVSGRRSLADCAPPYLCGCSISTASCFSQVMQALPRRPPRATGAESLLRTFIVQFRHSRSIRMCRLPRRNWLASRRARRASLAHSKPSSPVA